MLLSLVFCSVLERIRKKKCSPNAAILSLAYLAHQFELSHPRRDNEKCVTYLLSVVEKTQAKTKQNENPDMCHANFNAKNLRKVLM